MPKHKTKERVYYFKIEDKMFKTEPLFLYNCTAAAAEVYLRTHYRVKEEINPTATGTVLTLEKAPWRIVWLRHLSKKPEDLGTLVHELTHLAVRICRDKGIPIVANIQTGECGDETVAYIMDYFFREVIKKL